MHIVTQQKLLINKEFEKAKLTSGNRRWNAAIYEHLPQFPAWPCADIIGTAVIESNYTEAIIVKYHRGYTHLMTGIFLKQKFIFPLVSRP